jgi:hypothetical protein
VDGLPLLSQSTGQCLQRPLIAFDAWLLALGRRKFPAADSSMAIELSDLRRLTEAGRLG